MSSALLELPTFRRLAAPFSVEEYHRLGEFSKNGRRTELLRGFIIEKMSKSSLHASLLRRLFRLVQAALGPDLLVLKEDPLTLADSEPEPDLAVVTRNESDYADAHPTTALLVIEVAVTSEELDRAKAPLYAEAGISEYWLILPERACVEIHTTPRDGLYTQHQTHRPGDTPASAALPALRVDLASLFRS